jgi:hypothetical protein
MPTQDQVQSASDAAVNSFLGLNDQGRKTMLERLSPGAKDSLLAGLRKRKSGAAQPTQPILSTKKQEPEGFWKSLKETLPIPDSGKDIQAQFHAMTPGQLEEHIQNPMAETIQGRGAINLYNARQDLRDNFNREGFEEAVSGALGPVGGESMVKAGEQFRAGNWRGGLGTTAGLILPIVIGGEIAPGGEPKAVPLERQVNLLTAGLGEHESLDALPGLMKDINTTAELHGRPTSPEQLSNILETTSRGYDRQFKGYLEPISRTRAPSGIRGQIAQEILKVIGSSWQNSAEGRANMLKVQRVANEYAHPLSSKGWTYEMLYDKVKSLNNELSAFYKKSSQGQASALEKVNADVMKAERDAISDQLYSAVEKANPGSNIKSLKSKQGGIWGLRDYVNDKAVEFRVGQRAHAGRGRLESVEKGTHAYVSAGGPRVHTNPMRMFEAGPGEYAGKKITKAFKGKLQTGKLPPEPAGRPGKAPNALGATRSDANPPASRVEPPPQVERRTTTGASPTGSERRTLPTQGITGPPPEQLRLIQDARNRLTDALHREGTAKTVEEMTSALRDKKHAQEAIQRLSGTEAGLDIASSGGEKMAEDIRSSRAKSQPKLSKDEAKAKSQERSQARTQRFEKPPQLEDQPTATTKMKSKNPTPDRSAKVHRGMNGPVDVTFPDAKHKDLFSAVGRASRQLQGKETLKPNFDDLARQFGVSREEIYQLAKRYKDEIMKNVKNLEEGERYVAPPVQ